MDPMFGMPAVKDSRAMDSARQKNQSCQKLLSRRISLLDDQCSFHTSKINSDAKELAHMLEDLSPSESKGIVLPRGMSHDERSKYKQLRRGSLPSISLEEFDSKMKELRRAREMQRERSNSITNRSTETAESVEISELSTIVPELSKPFVRKRSTLMKEALDRAISSEKQGNLFESELRKLPEIRLLHSFSPQSPFKSEKLRLRSNTGEETGFLSTVREQRGSITSLSPVLPDLAPGRSSRLNYSRRRTLSEIPDFSLRNAPSEDGEPLLKSALAKVGDIIETWQTSPPVKPFPNANVFPERQIMEEEIEGKIPIGQEQNSVNDDIQEGA